MTDKNESYKYAKYKTKYLQSKQIGGDEGNLQDITTHLFSHLIMIKMLHFQSAKYGAHKALDDYYDKFNANMDRFMEVLQGDKGRITISSNTLEIQTELTNDTDISERLNQFGQEVLTELVDERYGDNSGLISVRDEMIAEVDNLKYLLTFNR
jgi:Family of unknown function (DUF5856)